MPHRSMILRTQSDCHSIWDYYCVGILRRVYSSPLARVPFVPWERVGLRQVLPFLNSLGVEIRTGSTTWRFWFLNWTFRMLPKFLNRPLFFARLSELALMNRTKKVIGQLESISHALNEDRSCAEVLLRLAAGRRAISSLMRELAKGHIRNYMPRMTKSSEEASSHRNGSHLLEMSLPPCSASASAYGFPPILYCLIV
jgi:DNA-binding FrmR family transcriptional regulator